MKKNNSVRETINEMRKISRLMREGYLYDEEMPQDEAPMGEEPMEEDPRGEGGMSTSQQISQFDERIAKIREICLDGLKEYAEDVNSAQYGFFKKTFLEADKVAEEAMEAAHPHEEQHLK